MNTNDLKKAVEIYCKVEGQILSKIWFDAFPLAKTKLRDLLTETNKILKSD